MKQPATAWVIRRLERLLAEARQALEQVDAQEELHRQMLQLGRQIDAAYRQLEGKEPTKAEIRALRQQQEQLQQQIEALRRQADGVLDWVRDWHQRVRQMVLEAAAQHSGLLPMARELARMRAPRERGAQALRLEIVEARSQLEAALGQFLPKMPEMPAAVASPAPAGKPAEALLTVREAAALLALSNKTLYRMASLGQVPHVWVGRSLRFRREELEAWIRQQSIRPRRVR
jgi:excisionase family DNA binding protein